MIRADGTIQDVRPGGILVWVPFDNWDALGSKAKGTEVAVGFPDGRRISPEQRKKAHALLDEISKWSGYEHEVETVKEIHKQRFIERCCDELEAERFSLSNCSVTKARRFLTYLVEFCLEFDVQTNRPLIEYADDVERYMYACLKAKKCVICGSHSDLHHVDRVGMGANRKTIIHEGMRVMPLCRIHHMACHAVPQEQFDNFFHVHGVPATKEVCKWYGLKAQVE